MTASSAGTSDDGALPITMRDVLEARDRLAPYLQPTPLRQYGPLDAAVGPDIQLFLKLENHHPTESFKVRNALSALTALTPDEKRRGVVAATRGNHGLGLAYAGRMLSIPVTLVVPRGNNPEKNEGMRAQGARVVEEGRDYDEAIGTAQRLVEQEGLCVVHSTNNRHVLAGAATLALEMIEQQPRLDAMVFAVGGGSQAVGGILVARELAPSLAVYGAQSEAAAATHDSWHARKPLQKDRADTFADGIATRATYTMTFDALLHGLRNFVTVSEREIADAVRLLLHKTHNLAEGAGATGLAGVIKLRRDLAGKRVGVVLSGANIDAATLRRVMTGEL
ncbi:MAG: threonine/serine dehydratase [Myxococcota bacterium]